MAIERFKPQADWTTEEIVRNRRDGTVPEREEYTNARREALERAGLEPEDGDGGSDDYGDGGELTTSDYLRRIHDRGRA